MAERTVKLYGKVWGDPSAPASITVSFNGQQCFQGAVTTVSGDLDTGCAFDDMIVLATWEISTDVTGPNAFSFAVTGGDAIFHTMHANYMGPRVVSYEFVPGATWPSYQPSDADEVHADMQQLGQQPGDAAFFNKYGLTKAQAAEQIQPNEIISTDQNWGDLSGASTLESDGHDNVEIDGETQVRVADAETSGKWTYALLDGQTLTCTVQTVPAVL